MSASSRSRPTCSSRWIHPEARLREALPRRATTLTSVAFLKSLIRAVPCRIHTGLADNYIRFADAGKSRRYYGFPHLFGRLCELAA